MVGTQWTSEVEKAKIITQRGEGVKIKDIITRSGRSIIERILKAHMKRLSERFYEWLLKQT